jgi:dethiobiotin synthetase
MSTFFITGTDTDVGKTIVTALLTAYYKKIGKRVVPYKPVQSGAIDEQGRLTAPDVALYKKALPTLAAEDSNTYVLKKPSSPHLAAKEEGVTIFPGKIIEHVRLLEQKYETVLVEGAGGLIVPIQENGYCMIDLIKDLSVPVLLVARAGLGTINHTVLSVMALKAAGIKIAGIIFNRLKNDEDLTIEHDNRHMIEQLTSIPVIGTVPFFNNVDEVFQNDHLLDELFTSFQFEKLNVRHRTHQS